MRKVTPAADSNLALT